jgi:hypothetical protein
MDLETRNIKDVMTPYCLKIHDGKKIYRSFNLSDYYR